MGMMQHTKNNMVEESLYKWSDVSISYKLLAMALIHL